MSLDNLFIHFVIFLIPQTNIVGGFLKLCEGSSSISMLLLLFNLVLFCSVIFDWVVSSTVKKFNLLIVIKIKLFFIDVVVLLLGI